MVETVFYTPHEVAEMLRLQVETVYEYLRRRKLGAVRLGNRYRISKADLEEFLAAGRLSTVAGKDQAR